MTRIGTVVTLHEFPTYFLKPQYMAPEILQAKKYSEKVDIYSYAMILLEMVTGKPPFSGMVYFSKHQLLTCFLGFRW